MPFLRAATDILRITTGSAADVRITLSAMRADNAAPPALKAIPDLGPIAAISTAVTNQAVLDTTSGYTSGDTLSLGHLSAYNAHASTSTTVEFNHYDGTTSVPLWKGTLLAGEWCIMDSSGKWLHYDSNGGIYPSVGNAAVQADMEAASATDKYVSPGVVKYHPGVCKAWGLFDVAGATTAGYNVDAPTDNGTGDITMNITTDMSSASWCGVVSVEMTATTYAVANARSPHIRSGGQAAGTLRCDCIDGTATTQLVKDPTKWHIAAFGDQ